MELNRIFISPKTVAFFLGAVALLLVLASVATQLALYMTGNPFFFTNTFYVDEEYNIPSLFSTFILFCASLLLLIPALLERKQKQTDFIYWSILSIGFLYLAVDETIQIHEKFGIPIRRILGNQHVGIFHHFWIIPGTAIVIMLGLFFLKFFFRLPVKTRLNFLIAASMYIGGAIGVENLGGYYTELHGEYTLVYSMIATLEESLEMAGVILFIWSLLKYISEKYRDVRFQIGE